MNNPVVPNESPYLNMYEDMGFDELRQFIEDSLAMLSAPDINRECPRSKEEFVILLEKLRELDDRPRIPHVSLWYQPSEKLRNKNDKLKRLKRRLVTSHGEASKKKKDIQQMKNRQKELEREVAQLRSHEQQAHVDSLDAYERYANHPYTRALKKISRAIERTFRPQPTGHVPFEILPPGEATEKRVRGYYGEVLRKGELVGFSQERLDKVLGLPWEDWRPGTAGMYGYSIFTFAHTEKVLLECPVYANAIYVLDNSEDRLLKKMKKQELRDSGEARIIVHTGGWYQRLKQVLEIE